MTASAASAVSRFSGQGSPWAISVDSSATTGRPVWMASVISGRTSSKSATRTCHLRRLRPASTSDRALTIMARRYRCQCVCRSMNETQLYPLEAILRYCAAAAPHPWYPSEHARTNGIDRDSLDPHIDRLRMGGLIRLTDWVQDFGQGYALTEAGREILESPHKLSRLQTGELPGARPERPSGAGALTTWDRGEIVRSAIFERSRPVVMQFLLGANIAVFLAGLWLVQTQHLKEGEALHRTGAVFGDDLVRGDW